MSLPKNVVSVDLGNLPRPVALDLLDASAGASVVAYADPSGHTRLTLPYSASDTDGTVVKFYVDADEVWLSAKVNGHEVADAGGTTKHVVANPHRSDAAPVVQLEWNADRLNQAAPSGGSTPGAPIVRAFPFAFDTPGILTGAALYTPTVGDLLLDARIAVTTAWNGTTPTGDVGTFIGDIYGLLGGAFSGVDMRNVEHTDGSNTGLMAGDPSSLRAIFGLRQVSSTFTVSGANLVTGVAGLSGDDLPLRVSAANPIKVVVSQDGTKTGADPVSTQGAAILYLVTASPA